MSRHATTWERIIMSCHNIKSWEARDASCRILSDVVRAVPAQPRPTLPMSLYECPTSWAHPRLHTQHLPRHRHRSATPNRTSLPTHRSRPTPGLASWATALKVHGGIGLCHWLRKGKDSLLLRNANFGGRFVTPNPANSVFWSHGGYTMSRRVVEQWRLHGVP